MYLICGAILLVYLGWAWFLVAITLRNAMLIVSARITGMEPIEMPEWYLSLTFFIANMVMLGTLVASGLFALHAWVTDGASRPGPNAAWATPAVGTGGDVATTAGPAADANTPSRRVGLPGSQGAGGPSFDCMKARSATETTICSNPELGALDCRLAAAYGELRQVLGAKAFERVKSAQTAWLRERDSCGARNERIDAKYRERTSVLVELLSVRRTSRAGDTPAAPTAGSPASPGG